MRKLFANPTVRLALRALLAGGVAAATSYKSSGGTIAWHGLVVAGVLAFCEVFTPLNSLVGVLKTGAVHPAVPAAPPAP